MFERQAKTRKGRQQIILYNQIVWKDGTLRKSRGKFLKLVKSRIEKKKRRRRRRKNSSIITTQIDGRRDQVEESRGRKRWKRLVRKAAETGVTIDLRMTINPAALSVPKAPPSSPSE